MSEEGGFIDVESDEVPELGGEATATSSGQNSHEHMDYHSDKRAHHNLLERRRRDHIKDSFHGLRDCIPSLQGEKVSRAHILNKATEYIRQMQRGGSMREGEISELKKKNEVLEEQVRAIEQNRAHGSEQKIEEVLETVARQVQQKQKQREVQQDKTPQGGGKEKTGPDLSSGRDLTKTLAMATRTTTPTTVGSGADPKKPAEASPAVHSASTSSALNLLHLAGNLKNAQHLLSVLQKNLPQHPSLVKSLATKAQSVPAKPVQSNATAALPRGIVTATTVPKGSSLPPNLASALQQKPTGSNSPVLVGGKAGTATNHLKSQLKPTTTTTTSSSPSSQPSGVSSMECGQTGSETSLESGPSKLDDNVVQNSIKNAATQVLEASNLLQQQGGREMGGVSAASLPLQELIAQCFLNFPGANVAANNTSVASGSSGAASDHEDTESVAMDTDATVSAANVLAALGETLSNAASGLNNHLPPPPSSPPSSTTPHTPTSTHLTSSLSPPSLSSSSSSSSSAATATLLTTSSTSNEMHSTPVAKKPRVEAQL